MTPENMVHMANQIAEFFAPYPHDEAVDGVTDHFKKFWEPRMRKQIIEYARQGDGELHPIVKEAILTLDH